ncbi:MAG: arginine repressor [Armatimonadetes bacterium]|nr:arginine repressor [Armatimonadota bacterium]
MSPARIRERERRIREIVARKSIDTQEALAEELRRVGLAVTQATVSRDIKRLGLVKVATERGTYRYAFPEEAAPAGDAQERLHRAFDEFVEGVDSGVGLVVVKTLNGRANAVAAAIDEVRWPDVVGTVAGDDTIIVVPRTRASSQRLRYRLRALLTA